MRLRFLMCLGLGLWLFLCQELWPPVREWLVRYFWFLVEVLLPCSAVAGYIVFSLYYINDHLEVRLLHEFFIWHRGVIQSTCSFCFIAGITQLLFNPVHPPDDQK